MNSFIGLGNAPTLILSLPWRIASFVVATAVLHTTRTGRNNSITEGVFDALIVWKTDRIGRNKEEITLNKYHLKKNGVKIHYIAELIPRHTGRNPSGGGD